MINFLKYVLKYFNNTTNSSNIINGQRFSGNNITIINGKIIIDGFYWIVSGLFSKDWLVFTVPTTTKTLNI